MDGGGRLAESLIAPSQRLPGAEKATAAAHTRRPARRAGGGIGRTRPGKAWWRRLAWTLEVISGRFVRLPRHTASIAGLLIIAASAGFGVVRGGHVREIVDSVKDVRDMAANAVGFNIAGVALTGQRHLNREEILATAGVNGRASLLFFDVADARARLLTDPWIGEATVQKLLPNRLMITIVERQPFALWQKDGRVSVIAADGTVLEPYAVRRYVGLPFMVGAGADARAKDFLTKLDRHPELRANVRAFVLVAERRWNLRLKNGVDVRLPEFEVDHALDQLAALERDSKLSSRDIAAIDLRLPDRVTVRLSDAAAQAREDAAKKKQQKSKGGNA
jgi:cell division protein FtsQ